MPALEGPRFGYALQLLPPGRAGFRRWRYELWQGAQLHVAGWCFERRGAERALRRHAARIGHAMFGLTAHPAALDDAVAGSIPAGATVHVQAGAVRVALTPRAALGELE